MVALCKEKNVKLLCYGVLMVRENHHDLFDGMRTTQRDVKSVEVCVHLRVTALLRRNNVTRYIITYLNDCPLHHIVPSTHGGHSNTPYPITYYMMTYLSSSSDSTLKGGFISSEWLNKPEPLNDKLKNVSLRKYLPWIKYWGGWGLFQQMLSTLDVIAKKHSVSISNVAVSYVRNVYI